MSNTTQAFDLEDGEALNKAHPETFHIPTQEDRKSLRAGEHCKLVFKTGLKDGPVSERMWVQVTSVSDDGTFYHGEIDNAPQFIDAKHRDPVTFEPRHVVNIDRK